MALEPPEFFPYSADLTAGSLKIAESRVVADLLLRGTESEGWKRAMLLENKLQSRTPATAKRLVRLIRNRLETMTPRLWMLIRDGHQIVATHACLAATIKQNRLVADFFELVLREQYRQFAVVLNRYLWNDFIDDCLIRHSVSVSTGRPVWTESTIRRMRSSMFQILEQAGYIENTKTLRLQNVHIAGEVVHYLQEHDESEVLRRIQLIS